LAGPLIPADARVAMVENGAIRPDRDKLSTKFTCRYRKPLTHCRIGLYTDRY